MQIQWVVWVALASVVSGVGVQSQSIGPGGPPAPGLQIRLGRVARPAPFQCWVDDDFDASTPGWGVTHFEHIRDALRAVGTGGRVLVHDGTYPESLTLNRAVELVGQDDQNTVLREVGTQDMIVIRANDCSVRGLHLQNDGAGRNGVWIDADRCWVQGLRATGALRVQVWGGADHCRIDGNAGFDRLHVGHSSAAEPRTLGTWITNNTLGTNPSFSLVAYRSDALVLSGNHFQAPLYDDGIDLNDCQNAVVSDNVVDATRIAIYMAHCHGSLVAGNEIHNPGLGSGIDLRYSNDNRVTGNTLAPGSIGLTASDNNRIDANRVTGDAFRRGLVLVESVGCVVEDNVLLGSGLELLAMLLEEWNTHAIVGNTADGRPIRYYRDAPNVVVPADTGQAILAACPGFVVDGVHFERVSCGVQAGYSDGGVIRGCEFLDCNTGVRLHENASTDVLDNVFAGALEGVNGRRLSGGRVRGNYVAAGEAPPGAGGYGVMLDEVDDLEITGNLVAGFFATILVECASGGNRVHHNSFVTPNLVQAYCGTEWDDGYPSGGNYWGDYAGEDLDGDGIGDTPYPLGPDANQDRYPLMRPPGGAELWAERHALSASAGGSTTLRLEAGRTQAGRSYRILGSASGTSPGFLFGGRHLPLNRDAYFDDLLFHPFSAGRDGFSGMLDENGRASIHLLLAPGAAQATLHHAGVLLGAGNPLRAVSLVVEATTDAVPLHLLE